MAGEKIGFSGKVRSLTKTPNRKTHERDYSINRLFDTPAFTNESGPNADHCAGAVEHERASDDVRDVAVGGIGSVHNELTLIRMKGASP